jgi:hypothetical protein
MVLVGSRAKDLTGYYPPDHPIVIGPEGSLDSFEALSYVSILTMILNIDCRFQIRRELAELLGQVKPPTVSKEEIEQSGLEILKPATLEQYEKDGKVSSTCTEKVSFLCRWFPNGLTKFCPVSHLPRRV